MNQSLKVEDSNERFNPSKLGNTISLPIAHGEGNYRVKDSTLDELEANRQVLLRYQENPNGSINDIAGIRNREGNVLGMMPHPERAVEPHHPCEDGLEVLRSFLEPIRATRPVELIS